MVRVQKAIFSILLLFFIWVTGKFFLPFLFPFLLGTGIALAAEPAVRLGTNRLRLPRGLASGLGVTFTLVLLSGIVVLLGALVVRELGSFLKGLPQMAQQSADLLENALVSLSEKAPEPVGPVLTNSIHRFFRDTSVLTDQAVQKMPGMVADILEKVPGKAMILGTGILSGYFISARLPKLKALCREKLPSLWKEKTLPALQHLRSSLGKWLTAQGKLLLVTYGIVSVGLTLLGIPYAFAWAILVAAVDAIPLLGTGTVLLPWALTKLLQGSPLIAAGMVVLYFAAFLTRTVLEPRFYGSHLGLDPLVMLIFLYFGYRLWGFWGIVISPLLAATTKALTDKPPAASP